MHITRQARIGVGVLIVGMILVACGGETADRPVPTSGTATSLATTTTSSITSSTAVTTTPATSTSDPSSTTAPTTTTSLSPLPPPPSFTIPVGPEGVLYRAGASDLESLGPGLLAVTDDGAAHIIDPVEGRLVSVTADGIEFVDLLELDILAVTAMTADGFDLIVVEVFFGPVRQRIHRIDPRGTIVSSVDLPPGYRLEDGLSAVLADDDGDVVIEFGGGGMYGRYDAATGTFAQERRTTIRGVAITPASPDVVIDGTRITADLVGEFGGLRYLATDRSGNHVLERVDVLEANPVLVLRTVEWYSPDGDLVGSALVPSIDEQAIDVPPALSVMPSGDVIVLLALEDEVVVRPLDRQPTRLVG